MTHKELEEFLLSMPGAWLDYPFGEGHAVYKVGHKDVQGQEEKMFALVFEDTSPLRVNFKCDPQLSLNLQEKYESVLPGYHMNKKHWISLSPGEDITAELVDELVTESYLLVVEKLPKEIRPAGYL